MPEYPLLPLLLISQQNARHSDRCRGHCGRCNPVGNGQPPAVITISLHSKGEIRLFAESETFLTASPFDSEGTIG